MHDASDGVGRGLLGQIARSADATAHGDRYATGSDAGGTMAAAIAGGAVGTGSLARWRGEISWM